jgi:hypothetical protein
VVSKLAFLQTRVFRLAAKIEEFMPIENPAGVARQDWDNEPAALLMSAIKAILIDGWALRRHFEIAAPVWRHNDIHFRSAVY